MVQKSYMSISEFARITGIKADNLRFYDKIGLLSPESRGDNDYRQYTKQQLSTAYLIGGLRELGIGLEEIRNYANERTPERMFQLFGIQKKRIQAEIRKLRIIADTMNIYEEMAKEVMKYEEQGVRLEMKKKEPVFMGPPVSREIADEEFAVDFYDFVVGSGVEAGYPLGAVIARADFEAENPAYVYRYYLKVKDKHNFYKPEGLYAAAYGRCATGQSGMVYRKLLRFIQENKLRMIGDAYEEYPLNELSIKKEEEYCVKVEIMVE